MLLASLRVVDNYFFVQIGFVKTVLILTMIQQMVELCGE
ncbi:hypothetical protein GV51_1226 [Gardnerella vaginalis 5-1]|nr:hypothetical protein GV51_1226 [Gardnerella vaginalis 5-1]